MAWQTVLCLLLAAVMLAGSHSIQQQTCTKNGNTAEIQPTASAMLGGIISLSDHGTDGFGCGKPRGSMQAYEAIRWVLDLLNKKDEFLQTQFLDNTYVPGVTLGMKVVNPCSSSKAAVAGIGHVYEGLDADAEQCTQPANQMVFGIVGGSSSGQAIDLSLFLQPLEVPLISYEATAPLLTMSGVYKNFMRTVAPDSLFTEVITRVMLELDWRFIAIVYDSGTYGRAAYRELHERMVEAGLCLTAGIPVDGSDVSDANMDSALNQVLSAEVTGVVVFGNFQEALLRRGNARMDDTGELQWIVSNFPVDNTVNFPYMRGIISVTYGYRFIVEFEDHWIRLDPENPSSENPWLKDWYEEAYECSFNPVVNQRNCDQFVDENLARRTFQQDQFVEPAVMAVFTYAKALRMAQKDKCASETACSDLVNMDRTEFYENYVKKVDFTFTSDERVPSLASMILEPYKAAKHLSFDDRGDIEDPSFFIWNYNDIEFGQQTGQYGFKRIGTFLNNFLDMDISKVVMYNEAREVRLPSPPPSHCPATPCSPCLGLPSDAKYFYEHGDVIINGIFSLHDKGQSPMTCGQLKSPNQVMYIEAMIYALRSVNNDNSILRNIKLGGLGIDDCSSLNVGQAFLSDVQRRSVVIHDSQQHTMDPHSIQAYTAAHTSPLTDPLAMMMNHMKNPLVAYRAGSPSLDNQKMYPYFIRSSPFLQQEIRAIVLVLKYYHWMHVQAITSDDSYAKDAIKLFRAMAAKEGICVVATHNMHDTAAQATHAVLGLAMNHDVPVTVAILNAHDHHRLLETLHANLAVRDRVTLIASTGWGTTLEVGDGMKSTAEGVISLSLRHSPLQSFQNYLRTLHARDHEENPWFLEWFMAVYDCKDAIQNCDVVNDILNDGPDFEMLYEVESVINGIKALAIALDHTLEHYCGTGYTGLCLEYTSAADKGLKYMEKLREVQFNIEDMPGDLFQFVGSSPAIPYEINLYQNGNYERMGDVNPWTHSVSMLANRAPAVGSVNTMCHRPCIECLYMFNHMEYIYSPGDIMLGAMFNVHYSGNEPFTCGDVRIHNGAMYTEVFNFAVDKINAGTAGPKLNGVTLGYVGFDGCSNPTRSQAIINRVSAGSLMLDNMDMNLPEIMSWITYDSESTRDAALFLQKLDTPVVSPGATAPELRDLAKFQTLFRTVQSDAVIAQGMANFVNTMGWKYVFVLNSPDASNRESAHLFREYLKDFGICVLAQYEFVTDGSMNVILTSLVTAESQVVAVFSEPDEHIEAFLKEKTSVLFRNNELEFIANRPWTPFSTEVSYRTILANSVYFQTSAPTIVEFLAYFNSLDASDPRNPWLPQIYGELFDCDFPGYFSDRLDCTAPYNQMGTRPLYSQDIWALSTINAVYALAEGFHRTLKEKCGDSYSGVCSKFLQDEDTRQRVMHHMDEMTFTDITNILFDFVQREANRGYRLIRYTSSGSTALEGELSGTGVLNLNDEVALKGLYAGIKSECSDDCLVCQDADDGIDDFSFIPGDMYIVGLFDVHKKGSTPYTCGELNTKHGAQLLEAFHFALDYVNNGQGIFSDMGIQIGGIGLDMCQSPSRAANLVANIHSGKVTLRGSGTTIVPRNIDAYIGTMDTESSIRVADILSQLLIPQVSYGATGMDLLDREKYDYFMRSVPADDKMARAIISYLKKFGYNNIQVIESFDEIGEPGAKEFERLAEINLVCITKKYLVGETGNIEGEAPAIVQEILSNSQAQVVVLWMKDPLPVLKAVNLVEAVYKNTLFVATDKWGFDPDSLKSSDLQRLLSAKNLIILDVETADVPGFDTYLAEKTPDNYFNNPWFKELYQHYHSGCDWDAGDCDKFRTISRLDHYVQDPYVLYVVNAVFSVAKAIEGAVRELCSVQSQSGVCNFYVVNGERRQRVLSHLKKAKFVDDTHQPFFFTEDGQSDRGFHFYNVTEGSPVFEYENVGSYNDSHFLKLDITYNNNFNALCDPLGENPSLEDCVCPFKPDLPTRYMKKTDGGRGLTLVYVGDIHQDDPDNRYRCGKINTGADLYRMLAFFYAIERINVNEDLHLPDSIRLDGVALDTCTNSLRLGQDVYNILSGNEFCDSDEKGQVVPPSSIAAFVVDKDKNAIPISTMLSQKGITSISPTATHAALDDPYLHGTFLRTHGSDTDTVQVILEVARQLGWDMIGVVYTDTPSHRMAKETLLAQSRNGATGMCIGTVASLPLDADDHDAHEALDDISRQVGVTGVVLFVEPAHFRLLMESSQDMGSTGIIWIVTSDWPEVLQDIKQFRAELASSVWIQSRTAIHLDDFHRYVKSLTLDNHMGIPDDWFLEIYETLHQCKILDLEDRNTRLYSSLCTGDERIGQDMLSLDPAILHTIISVYAAAEGLNNIPKCTRTNLDVAACLQLQEHKYQLVYDGIRNVRFEVLPELLPDNLTFTFAFNRDGNGDGGYQISSLNDNGKFTNLGTYASTGLDFEIENYQQTISFSDSGVPTSRCAPGATCKCYGPHSSEYNFTPEDVDNLENVQVGRRYRDPDSGDIIKVSDIPESEDRFQDAWAIIVLVLAVLGAVVALALFAYLLVMYPVRGGTSILGYIVSLGIVLMYLMVIAFIYHASKEVCALRRFGLGLVYAIVYSALLVKLVDCCRVRGKNDTYSAKYSKLGRPMGLFFVTVFLVLIQVMINAEWMILEEPDVERVFYKDMYWPRCTPDDFYDEGLVLSLCYVMGLILLAFCLGIWTFTLNVNHRESRWIFGIIILSIPCWVIWCSVAAIGAYKVRDAAVAVGLLINATFMLLLMPVRKLYLLNKYNKMIEEEDKQMIDGNSDYGSVYGRQYDNRPQLHPGSVRGSSIGYAASQPREETQNY